MPRTARVIAEGYPHHITQRGNYKQRIFEKEKDFRTYLTYFEEYSKTFGTKVIAFCLMNNHVHYIAVPEKKDSLANTFKGIHMKYSQYFNKKKGVPGHLWQSRYYSSVIDEDYLEEAIKYVERNPVRAKMVKKAWQWRWSSAKQHSGEGTGELTVEGIKECTGVGEERWRKVLSEKEDEEIMKAIRKNSLTGRPTGKRSFIEKLENKLNRRLTALSWGRPKKKIQRDNK